MRKNFLKAAALGAAMMAMFLAGCSHDRDMPNGQMTYQSSGNYKGDHCVNMKKTCCYLLKKYGCNGMDMDGCKRIAMSRCKGIEAMSGCARMMNSCGIRMKCCTGHCMPGETPCSTTLGTSG